VFNTTSQFQALFDRPGSRSGRVKEQTNLKRQVIVFSKIQIHLRWRDQGKECFLQPAGQIGQRLDLRFYDEI
jgi:hypothetical protein